MITTIDNSLQTAVVKNCSIAVDAFSEALKISQEQSIELLANEHCFHDPILQNNVRAVGEAKVALITHT